MRKLFITTLSAVLSGPSAYAHGPGEGFGPGMMMGWGYGMGWFWPILMIAVSVSVVVGVILLIRWVVMSTDKGRAPRTEESALDILKKRYARGEIGKEDYERIKKDIS